MFRCSVLNSSLPTTQIYYCKLFCANCTGRDDVMVEFVLPEKFVRGLLRAAYWFCTPVQSK